MEFRSYAPPNRSGIYRGPALCRIVGISYRQLDMHSRMYEMARGDLRGSYSGSKAGTIVPGTRHGQWEVLEVFSRSVVIRTTGKPKWFRTAKCRCSCGAISDLPLSNLVGGSSLRCRACAARAAIGGRSTSQDELAVAWAAGLFEGEGSVILYRPHGRAPHPRIQLSSTDEDVIRRFAAVVGRGRVYGPYQKKDSRLPRFDWTTGSWLNCAEIAGRLWPYLGERRRAKMREVLGDRLTVG